MQEIFVFPIALCLGEIRKIWCEKIFINAWITTQRTPKPKNTTKNENKKSPEIGFLLSYA